MILLIAFLLVLFALLALLVFDAAFWLALALAFCAPFWLDSAESARGLMKPSPKIPGFIESSIIASALTLRVDSLMVG